jgi:hypothetical protein
MRRFAAHLAIAAVCLGTLTPFVVAVDLSDLPACCRRSGRHHCENAAGASSSSNPEFHAVRSVCPYAAPLPLARLTGLKESKFGLVSPGVIGFKTTSQSRPHLSFAIFARAARGPPSLL